MKNGIAERIYWDDLSADLLHRTVNQMLNNRNYTENIKTLSKIFRDQKESPMDRAIWWIEWILRNPKPKHLKSIGHDFNSIKLQSLDVIFVAFILIGILFWLVLKMFMLIFTLLSKRGQIKSKKD